MTKTADDKPIDIYRMFGTDADKEVEGIVLNYSDLFWIKIARSGGANSRYKRILREKSSPFKKAIETEAITDSAADRLMREIVAEGVVLGWGSTQYGDGKMPAKDGTVLDFSVASVCRFFTDLPDIFRDVQEQSGKAALFRQAANEGDAKN